MEMSSLEVDDGVDERRAATSAPTIRADNRLQSPSKPLTSHDRQIGLQSRVGYLNMLPVELWQMIFKSTLESYEPRRVGSRDFYFAIRRLTQVCSRFNEMLEDPLLMVMEAYIDESHKNNLARNALSTLLEEGNGHQMIVKDVACGTVADQEQYRSNMKFGQYESLMTLQVRFNRLKVRYRDLGGYMSSLHWSVGRLQAMKEIRLSEKKCSYWAEQEEAGCVFFPKDISREELEKNIHRRVCLPGIGEVNMFFPGL